MHATHLIHTLGPGGAEQVLVDLARASAAGGFTMSVVALVGDADLVNARSLTQAGVDVQCVGLSSRWDPRAFQRTLAIVREQHPDVVHTHLKHADIVGAVVARRLGVPQVSTLHVIEDSVGGVSAGKRWVAGKVRTTAATRTIAVSEAQRQWYLANFPADPDRVVTVHNGVVPAAPLAASERSRVRAGLGLAEADVVAANVAIMRPGKGHEDLLAATRMLPADSPVRVLLVGDGDQRAGLEETVAADEVLRRRVVFAGYRNDVPELLQAVELVVHPTHADALPTSLIHALAAGVPVIASRVGGVPEIVTEGTGVLLPVAQPALLADALQELGTDATTRTAMGAAGRRRFAEEFEAGTWAGRLGDLYRELSATGDRVLDA